MKHKSIFFTFAFASLAVGFAACSEQENGVEKETVPAEKITVPAAQNGVPAAQNSVPANSSIEWLEKMEPAFEKAKAEGKMVLVEFTGSDWCPPCRFLRGEVFPSKPFVDYAKDKFVFVELDFPRMKKQSKETQTYNESKLKAYNVSGFPTLVMFDAGTEKPVAVLVGGAETPEAYVARFSAAYDSAQKLMVDLAAANAETDGNARATKLNTIYQNIDPAVKAFYNDALETAILAADSADKFAIAKKREERQVLEKQFNDFKNFMNFVAKTFASTHNEPEKIREAVASVSAKLETVLADNSLRPRVRQMYLYHVLVPICAEAKNYSKEISVCEEIIALNPETREAQNAVVLLKNTKAALAEVEAQKVKTAEKGVPAAKIVPANDVPATKRQDVASPKN